MADADTIETPVAPVPAAPPPPETAVDTSNIPAFARMPAGMQTPYRYPDAVPEAPPKTMWEKLTAPDPWAKAAIDADPLNVVASAGADAETNLATKDVPALAQSLKTAAIAVGQDKFPDQEAPGGENLWNIFSSSLHANNQQDWMFGREQVMAEAAAKRIADIKEATGVALPDPFQGGYAQQAHAILDAQRAKENPMGPRLFDPVKDTADLQKIEMGLFQSDMQELADKHQGNTDRDRDALQAIGLNRPLAADMPAVAQQGQAAAQSEMDKSGGYFIPPIASFLGSTVSTFRNPINALSMAILPEIKAAGPVARIAESAVKQAAIQMGVTSVQEPGIQAWHKELGEENGLMPALKDIGTSALYGAVPGGLIQGIREVGRAFGPSSTAAINEFVRQATATDPNARGAVWRKEIDDFISARDKAQPAGPQALLEGPKPAGEPAQPSATPTPPPEPAARAPAAAERVREVPPAVENQPEVTSVTPAGITSAELDHAASPPRLPDVSPSESLGAYQGMVRHGENPDVIAPPLAPMIVPDATSRAAIPADHTPEQPVVGQTDIRDGKPITYTSFDPRTLGTDSAAFQYKGGGDQAGVTDRLKGVEKWDPLASGNTVVYERNDGQRFIVDGHQRLGLANRLISEGKAQNISFNGALLKESDGWTTTDARAIAAKKNIMEGSGEALDTARVLRDRPDMWDKSLPTSRPALKQAKGLADLSDQAWGMMLNGAVPQNYAAMIGQGMPDKTAHVAVMDDMAKMKPKNENEARMMIADANAAGFRTEIQDSLFGPAEATRSLLRERAQVYGAVITMLKDDKKIFGMLDREAEKIEAAGNTLVDSNATQAQRAEQLGQILETLATRNGPVSAALNRAAQNVADGTKVAAAARAFVGDVDRLIKEEGLRLEIPKAPETAPPRNDLDTPQGREAQTRELEAQADDQTMSLFGEKPLPTPSDIGLLSPQEILADVNGALKTGSIDANRFSAAPTTEQLDEIVRQGQAHEDAEVDRLFGEDAGQVKKWMKSGSDKANEKLEELLEKKYGDDSEQSHLVYGTGGANIANMESLKALREQISNIEGAVEDAANGDPAMLHKELSWISPKLPDINKRPELHTEPERIATLGLARAFEDMRSKGVDVAGTMKKAVEYTGGRVSGNTDDAASLLENLSAYTKHFMAPQEHVPAMDVAGIKEPAQTVQDLAPSNTAVAQAEAGGGPAAATEKPEPGLTPDQILALPEVKQAIETPRAINRDHSVPYLAGSSNTGGVTYIDKDIPPLVKIGNKKVDVAKYLNVHEQVEHALMVIGRMPYLAAHRIATEHEMAAVVGDKVNVKAYNRFMDAYVADTEKELGKKIDAPADLYEKPYPHSEDQFLVHEEAGDHGVMGNVPAEPAESVARHVVEQTKTAAMASPDPLDKMVGQVIQDHIEPLVDQAFPKEPIAARPVATIDQRNKLFEQMSIPEFREYVQHLRDVLPKGSLAHRTAGDELGNIDRSATDKFGKEKGGPWYPPTDKAKVSIAHNIQETLRAEYNRKKAENSYGANHDLRAYEVSLGVPESESVHPWMRQKSGAEGGPAVEPGAEGKPQTLIPGVQPVTDADRLRAVSDKPLRGGAEPAGGMFDEGARAQRDLMDYIPTENGLVERQQLLDSVPLETALAKFIGECQV
jgi:hypothetical protein